MKHYKVFLWNNQYNGTQEVWFGESHESTTGGSTNIAVAGKWTMTEDGFLKINIPDRYLKFTGG